MELLVAQILALRGKLGTLFDYADQCAPGPCVLSSISFSAGPRCRACAAAGHPSRPPDAPPPPPPAVPISRRPIPFIYIHLVNFISILYLPLFSYGMARALQTLSANPSFADEIIGAIIVVRG